MISFDLSFISATEDLPAAENVSAVFLIALKDNQIIVIRNHRGWDLPAGHLEPGETIEEALAREVHEEASMSFKNATPFVKVVSDDKQYAGKCMIGYAANEFILDDFSPAPDSEERLLMGIDEFISLYKLNKENMKSMILKARALLETK